jgi:hypothetical protein
LLAFRNELELLLQHGPAPLDKVARLILVAK